MSAQVPATSGEGLSLRSRAGGCRGTNEALEMLYDEVLKNGRATLTEQAT